MARYTQPILPCQRLNAECAWDGGGPGGQWAQVAAVVKALGLSGR
jgi:hypothetical protein